MIRALLQKQLRELFASFARSSRSGRQRSRLSTAGYALLFLALLAVLAVSFSSMALPLAGALVPQGRAWLYFAYMELTALLVSVLASAFSSYSSLFRSRDDEMLLSLPIPPGMIFAVRVGSVCLTALLYLLLVWVPAVVCYALYAPQPMGGLLSAVPMALLLTGAAAILAVLVGWGAALVSARARHKSLVVAAASLGFVGLYYAGFLWLQRQMTALVELPTETAAQGGGVFFWLGRAAEGSPGALCGLALLVAGCVLLCFKGLSVPYLRRMTARPGTARVVYHERQQRAVSVRQALLRRELQHLGSSAAYLLNCTMSTLFLPLLGAAALWKAEVLRGLLQAWPPQLAAGLLCCVVCAASASNLLTAPSISLEGHTLWQLQCLPVTPWQVLQAKLELHLLLTALPGLLCAVCLLGAAGAPLGSAGLVLLVTALFELFAAASGLTIGLLLPSLNWTNEAAVVKRSLGSILALLGNAAVVLGMGLLLMNEAWPGTALPVCGAVLAGADALLLRWLKTGGAARLAALG